MNNLIKTLEPTDGNYRRGRRLVGFAWAGKSTPQARPRHHYALMLHACLVRNYN